MVSNRIIFIDNVLNALFSLSSIIILEVFYKYDKESIITNYDMVLIYHITCYINFIFFFLISLFVKSNIFYITWRLSVYFIQLAIFIMTFYNLIYTIKYPTYFFMIIHCHFYTTLLLTFFMCYCMNLYNKNKNKYTISEYNTENSYFPIIIEKNDTIPETIFPIQTCGYCNQLQNLFLLDCGHTLCEKCGKSRKIGMICPYCGKLFSTLKRIYL